MEVILRHVNAAMTVLLVSWDFIAIQRDVYFIVRLLIAVLIMFTYIYGPSFFLLACYIMFTMFNDDLFQTRLIFRLPPIIASEKERMRDRQSTSTP